MQIPARLFARMLYALERGLNWTDLTAGEDHDGSLGAKRDKRTIERTLHDAQRARPRGLR